MKVNIFNLKPWLFRFPAIDSIQCVQYWQFYCVQFHESIESNKCNFKELASSIMIPVALLILLYCFCLDSLVLCHFLCKFWSVLSFQYLSQHVMLCEC